MKIGVLLFQRVCGAMLRTLEEHAAQNCPQFRWAEFTVPLEPDHSAIQQSFQHHAEVFVGMSLRMF